MFCLSFNIMAFDKTKSYIYFNGQRERFEPNDMLHSWKHLFVFRPNLISNKIINQIKTVKIIDNGFEQFYKNAIDESIFFDE